MSFKIEPQISVDGKTHILYDTQLVDTPSADLFNVDSLKGQGVLEGTAGGRGASFIVRFPNRTWVLRHYRRGGLVGKVLNDQYCGCEREKSRSWREWRLLHLLFNEGFPVPRPIAASVIQGIIFYQADLITEFLPGTRTLAEVLTMESLPAVTWERIGACIARFHQQGVCHADLNAHNIMLDDGTVFLIDFDKGEILSPGSWQEANIIRLHRSLAKLQSERGQFSFGREEWANLLRGYQAA